MKILITGGAGFIGSNLVESFVELDTISRIRILDNLSTGDFKNIEHLLDNKKIEFIEGDIRDYKECLLATKDIDLITHQAALGSVPRSVLNPMESTEVNILGTVNILNSAVKNNVRKVVHAFSSSTYGDSLEIPKIENRTGNPLSPYAVTKSSMEDFVRVFKNIYGLNYVGLRYFNVFGPKQNPNGPYAAVIIKFINNFLSDKDIEIYGDGETTRDFTYIDNVVDANHKALFTTKGDNEIFNVACGEQISLNDLVGIIKQLIPESKSKVFYKPHRDGDVKHSLGSIDKARSLLEYSPSTNVYSGLKKTVEYIRSNGKSI